MQILRLVRYWNPDLGWLFCEAVVCAGGNPWRREHRWL